MITREEFALVKRLFREVAGKDPEQQRALLDAHCRDKPGVRAEIEMLLASDEAETFLERPALAQWPEVLEEPAPETMIGQRVGPYRIERCIGTGGMADVYLACRDDAQFEQHVAIKIVKRGMDTNEILRRFRHERQTMANLNHPHVARILDGGATSDGRPCLVMEYVDGAHIDRYCNERRLGLGERVRLFMKVCAAVSHAHSQLVVHRDLKPGNILVTDEGTPKLLDFGIARVLAPQANLTMACTLTGERLLTPLYASPEQVRGAAITTATDIYSLGVVLYELVVGRRPYDCDTRSAVQIERTICHEEPCRPSTAVGRLAESSKSASGAGGRAELARRGRQLRGDLDTIVMTALRKEPQRRYGSVEQFSEDLRRYLTGLPIRARADTFRYRTGKFIRRHALAVGAAAVFVALLMGFSAVSWSLYVKAQRNAEHRRVAEEEATQRLWEAYLAQAGALRSSDRPGRRFESLRVLREAAAIRPALELRNEAVAGLALSDVKSDYVEQTDAGDSLVSVEGLRRIDRSARALEDGTVRVEFRDGSTPAVHLPGAELLVRVLLFSPSGDYLAVKHHTDEQVRLRVWDISSRRVMLELPAVNGAAIAFDQCAPIPRWVAVGQPGATVRVYRLPGGELWRELKTGMPIFHIGSDPGRERLVVGGVGSSPVQLWDVESGSRTAQFSGPQAAHGVAISPDGQHVAAGCENHRIYLWDATGGRPVLELAGHQAQAVRVYFHPSGRYLGSWGWDQTTRIWDLRSGRQMMGSLENRRLQGFDRHFACWSPPHEYSEWRFEPADEYTLLPCSLPSGRPSSLAIGMQGRVLTLATSNGVVLWDLATEREITVLSEQAAQTVIVPGGGNEVLATTSEGLQRWKLRPTTEGVAGYDPGLDRQPIEVQSSELLWPMEHPEHAALDANGSKLYSLLGDKLMAFDLEERTARQLFEGYPGISQVGVSPDGRWCFTGSWRGEQALLLDTRDQRILLRFPSSSAVGQFSPDGRWLVVGDQAQYRFYETGTWKLHHRIDTGRSWPRSIAFSPGAGVVALAHSLYHVKMIELGTWRELLTLPNPGPTAVYALCFSPDGTLLAGASPDRAVHIWDLGLIRERLRDLGLDWNSKQSAVGSKQ